MKLLFKKNLNDEACDKLKELITYTDADLDFNNLKPDLITATNDIIDLIGQEIYNKAVQCSELETKNDLSKEFDRVVSYPIAINAYRMFAPTNDLSHTNNGRRMRSDDTQKTPFEWMLDRDNEGQERRYYRALDDLIQFLDSVTVYDIADTPEKVLSNEIAALWKSSEAFKESNSLFVRTVKEFDKCFPIKSRLLLIKLQPGLRKCELEEIIPRITEAKFDELKTKLKNADAIEASSDIKLLSLIREACVFYALSWSMMRYSVNLYPDGVLQYYGSDRATTKAKKPSLNSEPEAARQAFKSDFDAVALQIEKLFTPAPTQNQADETPIMHNSCSSDKFFTT